MRVQQASAPGGPAAMTWPPSERELDHFDVVDVPEDQRLLASTAATDGQTSPPPERDARKVAVEGSGFERPDWSELRLRGAQDEPARGSGWWPLLALVLALAVVAEGIYIWHLHTAPAEGATGHLRVDAPEGAEVRVDGRVIGTAPIEQALEPGEYAIEVVTDGVPRRADAVTVGQGRTVVVLPLSAPAVGSALAAEATSTPGATAASSSPPATPVPPPASAAPVAAAPPSPAARVPPSASAGAVSATRGAVLIESTPTGLPVTMEGRERGQTPITIGQLRPGRHDVLVGGLARQVDVSANTVTTLRVTRP